MVTASAATGCVRGQHARASETLFETVHGKTFWHHVCWLTTVSVRGQHARERETIARTPGALKRLLEKSNLREPSEGHIGHGDTLEGDCARKL